MSKRRSKKSPDEISETANDEAVEALASELSGVEADEAAAPGGEESASESGEPRGFRIGDGTGDEGEPDAEGGPEELAGADPSEDDDEDDGADEAVASDEDVEEDSEDEGEEDGEEEERVVAIFDADREDAAEALAQRVAEAQVLGAGSAMSDDDDIAPGGHPRELAELMSICEALIFVSEEPLSAKAMADVLREDKGWVEVAVESLSKEFNERNGGLMLREVAGGWQIATRPEHHEHVRAYLKSKPSAKLSLPALETLAVIAYKQPVTVPEILEIRGVQSSSAIKTLLDKRLIVAKGRKETVGRPMMYGTSKDFLLQFGLKDLGELPSIEDFEDLAAGES
jgi:segregation and condensation protein B